MIDTWVWIDDTFGPFEAKFDPANRWNNSLRPYFTLDTVRKIAARTQEMTDECGYGSNDTVHVIDGGTDRGEPRVVVLLIRWPYLEDAPASATSIIQPNDEGLYGIGGGEWTWYEAPNPAAEEPTMSDTDPPWLADAEAAYARRRKADAARQALAAVDQADRVNDALIQLGVTPIALAYVPAGGTALIPALLVEADPEEERYAVHADWDKTKGKVRLALGHYWGDYTGLRPGRLLTTVNDVVEARREGPASHPQPKRPTDMTRQELRKIVERAAAFGPCDGDSGELTALVGGLAAGVLYLADTVTHVNDRP
ncbi:hypothetical protein [Streptomyces sp. NPDC051677]|uniref:hypothetical protein n=1 Tax=Streptomyces sp. NPDC051677 TaxID=3365669 RepID=UPI0037CCD87F